MGQQEIFYSIADEVFQRFPDYVRGVVLAHGVTNRDSPAELLELLRSEEASVRDRLDSDALAKHPRFVSWREAYRATGSKPSKFRPSMEAMTRRVLKNQQLPTINALVDIGNVVSLRHMVPAGGHAIDVLTQDMALRAATGDEEFVPFGSDKGENPSPGEFILVEGQTVLTRRWTWRQANHTLLLPDTVDLEFNVDGLPPVGIAEIEQYCGEIMELIERFCGGTLTFEILSKSNPRMRLR